MLPWCIPQVTLAALNKMFPFLIYSYDRSPSVWQSYYHVSSFLMKVLINLQLFSVHENFLHQFSKLYLMAQFYCFYNLNSLIAAKVFLDCF